MDRARPGSKHHLTTDANGTPLAIVLTGANRNDVTQLLPLIAAIPHLAGRCGTPLHKPQRVYADRGHDHDKYRKPLHAAAIPTSIARRGKPHGSGLARSAGSSNAPMPGCMAFVACVHALIVAPTFMKPFSVWLARSFVGARFSDQRIHFEMRS